jgi:hypothetical protein
VKLWILYADSSDNSEAVFQHLRAKGIGAKVGLMYQGYALALELKKKYAEAEDMYIQGLREGAEPMRELVASLDAFKK